MRAWADRRLESQVRRVDAFLETISPRAKTQPAPVLFFNASTRIHMLSLNGAFSLLASWGLRARGVDVRYLVCEAGMEQCVLGTDRKDLHRPPPCERCLRFSGILFPSSRTDFIGFDAVEAARVAPDLAGRSMEELAHWSHGGYALGELCLPGLRWALRRHDLPDSEDVRTLFRQFLRSAASLVGRFDDVLRARMPEALVVFNGITYPEAVARAVAEKLGIRVVTHEVGLGSQSAYFSHEDATFRQVDLKPGDDLPEEAYSQLDGYLEARRRGQFSMAGIEFWPEMEALPGSLHQLSEQHQRTCLLFTNVIFDTSQVHANVIFESMFDWLDTMAQLVDRHPQTLFVLRAHPDENRLGKESQQSVKTWFAKSGLAEAPNVVFLPPEDRVSSYELIRLADLVLIYNSSVGLEAAIMGAKVLAAGRARFSHANTVFMPQTPEEYVALFERLLESENGPPSEHRANARRFLYKELYEASLDFSDYIMSYPSAPGMVLLRSFDPEWLAKDPVLDRIASGILEGSAFDLDPAAVS